MTQIEVQWTWSQDPKTPSGIRDQSKSMGGWVISFWVPSKGGGVFKCLATDGGGSSYFITEIGAIIFLKSDVTGIVRHAFKFCMHWSQKN